MFALVINIHEISGDYPANTRRLSNVGLMLGQRRRRWPNVKPALDKRFVFADVGVLL